MKSIIEQEKKCYFCGNRQVEEHHIFFGKNRKNSEKYGLKVYLCAQHHRGNSSPHQDININLYLKNLGRIEFEKKYSHEKFIDVFK